MKRIIPYFLLLALTACNGKATIPHECVEDAIEQAQEVLSSKYLGKEGLLHDYESELPTPEDCSKGIPNMRGWWSPIENGPMFTGLFLDAVCNKAAATGKRYDKKLARRLAGGLIYSASVSDVPGMIVRGIGTDGKCHYPIGSEDQTIPWFFGLYSYWKSDIPSQDEKDMIAQKVIEVTKILEANDWNCLCDGIFKGQYCGHFMDNELVFRGAAHGLFLLRAAYEMSGDSHWLEQYERMCSYRQKNTDLTMLEVCAEGLEIDIPNFQYADNITMWIYVCAVGCLARLEKMDTEHAGYFRSGLDKSAARVCCRMESAIDYDNHKEVPFKYANWKTGYEWMEQKTQDDAYKVACGAGDKSILGNRKEYEREKMTMPLSAAAICGFAGGYDEEIKRAVCAYDYSQINVCEFFLAELAAYPDNFKE